MMDYGKEKKTKGNLIIKTWERCKTIGRTHHTSSSSPSSSPLKSILIRKSRSLPHIMCPNPVFLQDLTVKEKRKKQGIIAPEGCFSVYVGPQKVKFVIKTEYVNHPMFQLLLEEAESEYGYHSEGPLVLPCTVDVFYKVLLTVDDCGGDGDQTRGGCGLAKGRHASYRLLSPPRWVNVNYLN